MSRAGAGASQSRGHDPVGDADEEGNDVCTVLGLETSSLSRRDELEKLVAKLSRVEEVTQAVGIGGEGRRLPAEEAVESELLNVDIGEGEKGAEVIAEIARLEQRLGVAELGKETEPGDEAKFTFLGRLVGVDVLDGDGVGVVVALETSEEDLHEIAAMLLSEVGNGAEKPEELSLVALDDESLRSDLGLEVEKQCQ